MKHITILSLATCVLLFISYTSGIKFVSLPQNDLEQRPTVSWDEESSEEPSRVCLPKADRCTCPTIDSLFRCLLLREQYRKEMNSTKPQDTAIQHDSLKTKVYYTPSEKLTESLMEYDADGSLDVSSAQDKDSSE
uniref:Putative secreted peptide n=1 Tax=Anopheles braziliensis TaxID=58242 RepID=A0A2M3ZQS4_9DIPT